MDEKFKSAFNFYWYVYITLLTQNPRFRVALISLKKSFVFLLYYDSTAVYALFHCQKFKSK